MEEAIISVLSLKRINPGAHCTLVTDIDIQENPFDEVILVEPTHEDKLLNGKLIKLRGVLMSPYEKTIFLDTDTYFSQEPQELFPLLD